MTSLAGQTVLVTGANRGMGRDHVGQLLDRGATKVYAAARDPRKIETATPGWSPSHSTSPTRLGRRSRAAAPDVGVLINNAGILRGASVFEADTTRLRQELETNLFGPMDMASAFAGQIAERPVRSSTSRRCSPGGRSVQSYGVTKAALERYGFDAA